MIENVSITNPAQENSAVGWFFLQRFAGYLRYVAIATAFAIFLGAVAVSSTAAAQDQPVQDSQQTKIEQLLKLLDDPAVRARLEAETGAASAESPPISSRISSWDDALQSHLKDMVASMKSLPTEVGAGLDRLEQRSGGYGLGSVLLYMVIVIAGGGIAEWLTHRSLGKQKAGGPEKNNIGDLAIWASRELIPVAVFALASLVIFLLLRLPPPVRGIVLGYLIAVVLIRLVAILSNLVTERLDSTDRGRFWRRRVVVFSAYFFVSWATIGVLRLLGSPPDTVQLLTYLFGIGLVALAIEIVWQVPAGETPHSTTRKWLMSIYLALLWCVWSVGLNILLWVGIFALLMPRVLLLTGQVAASFTTGRAGALSLRDVLIVRGARAAVVLLAVLWLGYILKVNPGVLTTTDTIGTQVIRALLRGVLILLVADLIWQLLKTYIDGMLVVDVSDPSSAVDASRRSRLRTLLPIFRNALAVLIATIAGLMILAEFGVQIGPLIAGAGIFGVAIGFGSQTLVKDIVSGVFYLADDAFRVGEYIQSGSYKGTVESFSLRSIRLRHHRGPVFTVPFGALGAIQNMSRDWAIDKFMIRVPFDTDIKLVKRLTKTVGAALLEDPELAPNILQTVKMKGVEQFGDYGIELSFSVMTTPGYQTSIRRRAYSMMKDTFAANGIEFARPSVTVGDEGTNPTAAAAQMLRAKAEKQAQE